MTGYGKHVALTENRKVTVEIRTLNSKQLDINLRLPHSIKDQEINIRKSIAAVLQRGKIDVFIILEQNSAESASKIDINIAKHYYSEIKLLADSLDQKNFNDYLSIILKMPEVLVQKESEINEKELTLVMEGVVNATN